MIDVTLVLTGLALLAVGALFLASWLRRSGVEAKADAALKAAETVVADVKKDVGQ